MCIYIYIYIYKFVVLGVELRVAGREARHHHGLGALAS